MFVKENWNIEELKKQICESNEKELYFNWYDYTDEKLQKLYEMLVFLDSMNENFKVIIRFNKVREVELAKISTFVESNLTIRISIDFQTYSYYEFDELNNKLNHLLDKINKDLSPYEKYIEIYNLVRKFKKYRVIDQSDVKYLDEIAYNKEESCNLKYILENEYMDCLGFTTLLHTLLNKCDIESYQFGVRVNLPNGIRGGHSRNIVSLDDDKYDIHGIFISDPTWDSENSDDSLQYLLLPIKSMRDSIYEDCPETLLFDVNNIEEFNVGIDKFKNSLRNHEKFTKKVISIINGIDRKESSKLMTLNSEQFNLELQNYIFKRSNKELINK